MTSKTCNAASFLRRNILDYVVVGAGPAGLAFASTIKSKRVVVLDLGNSVQKRDRSNPTDCLQGAGGAGLFSDGKFSFYPAGTNIWKNDKQLLKKAYQSLEEDMSEYGEIPPFPDVNHDSNFHCSDTGGWCLKSYPSIYIGLPERINLIEKLANRSPTIKYQTEFLSHREIEGMHIIRVHDKKTDSEYNLFTKNLVFAGGRFMPHFLNVKKEFRRYEFGFRISGPAHLFKKEVELNDPKYVFSLPGIEYRTFCWCEKGEVVGTDFKGIQTFSGRADCAPTDMSNFGFNIRVKDQSLLSDKDFQKLLSVPKYNTSINDFSKVITKHYPEKAAHLITYGLEILLKRFKSLSNDSIRILGPTIEGIGCYPNLNSNFSIEGSPSCFVIGDSSGTYRGIIPSMISGYLLAHKFNNQLSNEHIKNKFSFIQKNNLKKRTELCNLAPY